MIRNIIILKASVVWHLSKLSYRNPLSPIMATSIQILPIMTLPIQTYSKAQSNFWKVAGHVDWPNKF